MWVGERVWVWRRFFRRQASAVRAFSLNEFDGYREIGNARAEACAREISGRLEIPFLAPRETGSRSRESAIAAERDTSS